jgi:hypothetical protein
MLNIAGVQRLPILFICENNLYAASTNFALTARITDIAARAAAYGMPGVVVDVMRGGPSTVRFRKTSTPPTLKTSSNGWTR